MAALCTQRHCQHYTGSSANTADTADCAGTAGSGTVVGVSQPSEWLTQSDYLLPFCFKEITQQAIISQGLGNEHVIASLTTSLRPFKEAIITTRRKAQIN